MDNDPVKSTRGAKAIRCNLCGGGRFEDFNGRKRARCAGCGSLERTRLLALYLEKKPLGPESRVLHIAPELGLYRYLRTRVAPSNYLAADFTPSRYSYVSDCRRINLCQLDNWASEQFDLIVHSHVLEHVRCTLAYCLYHLHRMLAVNGRHVFVVPFMSGLYEECFDMSDREKNIRRFGQYDHVRRISVEDRSSHLGQLVRLPERFDAEADLGHGILDECNIPARYRSGFHGATVLDLAKNDWLLTRQ